MNVAHDSLPPLAGGAAMVNMMLGEVAPGGTGSGLYGMLILSIISVFIAGLMVGRTPEYLGKKIGPKEMKLAALYILVTPVLVLALAGITVLLPDVMANAPRLWPAPVQRSALRLHLRGQQQRLGVRRHHHLRARTCRS